MFALFVVVFGDTQRSVQWKHRKLVVQPLQDWMAEL
jgi:hypothetical protein